MHNYLKEFGVGVVVTVLGMVLLNPMNVFMPDALTMLFLGLFFLFFVVFAIFVWQEKALDEREEVNRMRASRTAYLATATILVLGICVQTFTHQVNSWLVVALGVGVLAKVLASYKNKKNSS